MLITRDDGSIYAERRYEPFGEEVDEGQEPPGGGAMTVGDVDYGRELHNVLNKPADPDTGWSYHGARWMAPETARWLTPDPPVKAPDPKLMAQPWGLHPYQYVKQNPVAYWDPDGEGARLVVAKALRKDIELDIPRLSQFGLGLENPQAGCFKAARAIKKTPYSHSMRGRAGQSTLERGPTRPFALLSQSEV